MADSSGAGSGVDGVDPYLFFVERHANQLESSGVPKHFWKTLHSKLSKQIFDAGSAFSLLKIEAEDGASIEGWKVMVNCEEGVFADDPESIYLVDHAWTFRPQSAREHLESVEGLVERIADFLQIDETTFGDREDLVDEVMDAKWKISQTYKMGNTELQVEDRMPIWYILDDFGTRIQHSDNPNFRLVPFVSLLDSCAYSLLFPIKDCEIEEEVTRDFLEGIAREDECSRRVLKNIWGYVDVSDIDSTQTEPEPSFFESSRENENLADPNAPHRHLPKDRKIKVFSAYDVICNNLDHPRFELVNDVEEADILWFNHHYKDFNSLSHSESAKRINQFPFESVVTMKDFLCVTCRRMMTESGEGPEWLPKTFNLVTELPQFVSYYQQREKMGLDNIWILKPWNLARALDTQVGYSLHHILKQVFSGPKIVQKYIEDPVLFPLPGLGKVKFDVRYILLLKSVKPLQLYAYNRFWLRFANQTFELKKFDVYEKHFTVMNYQTASHLEQMFCNDFIKRFDADYPSFPWADVEKKIFKVFKSAFEAAVKLEPPMGIGHNPQSRAMYASDVMLCWERDSSGNRIMQPKLLEINWGPDCKRACEYYPEFFNDVFEVLFLDDVNLEERNVTAL